MLGDQPAALYGQGCTVAAHGRAHAGHRRVPLAERRGRAAGAAAGVLATAAWEKRGAGPTYALEAFCANAGNALGLLPALGLRPRTAPRERPSGRGRIRVVVPAPAGLGTPHWHGADRITVLGASSTTTAADLAAAALAGVAHQIADALEAAGCERLRGRPAGGRRASPRTRGCCRRWPTSPGWRSRSPADPEATARGIAALAAEAAGLLDEAAAAPAIARQRRSRASTTAGGRGSGRAGQRRCEVHVRAEA